jgi:lantibiotic modifying enzyme
VDPDRLYLNADSLDVYAPPPGLEARATPAAAPAAAADGFLATAASLGARICRDALWADGRCNWTGFSMEALDGRWRHTHRAYGPEPYSGTSGIGHFLARLHLATGERAFRRTALGALRNALARAEDVEPPSLLGGWAGWSGIGGAVLEAAALLGEDSLRAPALALLGRVAESEPGPGFDVLAGPAGAIPFLLRAHRGLGGPASFVDAAVRLGDHLIAKANRSDIGWSWGEIAPGSKQKGDLLGFSHGAGGVGWSLMELWNVSRQERFRQAAGEAFRYERHWYDAERRNWPDLRDPELSGVPATDEITFMTAWCHGAAGISLSRLRAWQLTGDEVCRAEAEAALAGTFDHVFAGGSEMSQTNYCLCHGLGGNADALLEGWRVLGNADWRRRAEEVGRRGIETYQAQKVPWPCGTFGSVEVPGLMLGLAGIGWFYLRLADPEVPTALMVVP